MDLGVGVVCMGGRFVGGKLGRGCIYHNVEWAFVEVWWTRSGSILGVAMECLGGGNKLGGLLEMKESGEGEQEPGALSLYMFERPKDGAVRYQLGE